MFYVYIIKSLKCDSLYFGRTKNLDTRLTEHNQKKNTSTQHGAPWEYVYVEGYKTEKDAIKRELQLKQYGNARTCVKKRLEFSLS